MLCSWETSLVGREWKYMFAKCHNMPEITRLSYLLKYLNVSWSISLKLSNLHRVVHIILLLYFWCLQDLYWYPVSFLLLSIIYGFCHFFTVSLARGLSILLIFLKNQHFVSFIFSSFSVINFIDYCSLLFPSFCLLWFYFAIYLYSLKSEGLDC